jgi:hypothetical protein
MTKLDVAARLIGKAFDSCAEGIMKNLCSETAIVIRSFMGLLCTFPEMATESSPFHSS